MENTLNIMCRRLTDDLGPLLKAASLSVLRHFKMRHFLLKYLIPFSDGVVLVNWCTVEGIHILCQILYSKCTIRA